MKHKGYKKLEPILTDDDKKQLTELKTDMEDFLKNPTKEKAEALVKKFDLSSNTGKDKKLYISDVKNINNGNNSNINNNNINNNNNNINNNSINNGNININRIMLEIMDKPIPNNFLNKYIILLLIFLYFYYRQYCPLILQNPSSIYK